MSVLSAISLSRRAVLGFVAMGLMFGSFAALVPVLKARIGADDALFGLLLLGSPAGLLLALFLAPPLDRRLGPLSLPLTAFLLVPSFILMGFAAAPAVFFAAVLAIGLSAGLLDIVTNTRISELEAQHTRPLMNANHGMFSLAYAASAVATGVMREVGWTPLAIFGLSAGLLILLCPLMRMAVAPLPSVEERRAAGLPVVVVLLCGGIVLTAFSIEAVVESWSALHVERTLGGTAAAGAFGPAVLGLTMALGRFSGQAVSGRFADITIITWGSVMACLGALVAAVAGSPGVAYLGFALTGMGVSVVGPLALALAGRLVPPAHRAAAIARVNAMGFGAFMLAPLMVGLISEAYGLRVAFALMGAFAFAAPLLAHLLARRAYGASQASKKPFGT